MPGRFATPRRRASWISRDYGSILLGSADQDPRQVRVRIQVLLTGAVIFANLIGIVIAVSLGAVGIPEPSFLRRDLLQINVVAVPVYAAGALLIGTLLGTVIVTRGLRWSINDQIPTPVDVRRTLAARRRLMGMQFVLWLGAAVLLGFLYGAVDTELVPKAVLITVMCGLVVVAISNLLTDLMLRPVSAKILQAGLGWRGSSLRSRALSAWMVGTGVPLVGIFLVVFFAAFSPETSKMNVFVAVTVLTAVAVGVGMLVMILFAWSVTGPIRSVRTGMARVRGGDVAVEHDLVVYDASELGELQFGFNNMVAGLREQERMRDLFNRHVGRDVASAALAADPELGGAERVVAVVFVDVIGSTQLATRRSPTEVVDLLNQFFGVIVEATERNDGLVNKFEGDAVLSIFGAPVVIDDPAGAALQAAREIAQRLRTEVPDLQAGIGVSYGTVVAGNVGAISRFEYTVIGDPVNESARISESAKQDPRVPWASGRVVDAAEPSERTRWKPVASVVLRGRDEPTQLYVPRLIPNAAAGESGEGSP
ncbi:adenylate/guanylate cyclase domain-containing protein [Gordonia alkaliphila]|uniref:adenylate/guanylate cyclase domain-containing protein n=1 Tax=Gordonia alkaliphila TaxID=1053547 RepID=UPI001FF279EF|nr:adenylate/guanylate cyclase domain-containing protein [Gordonia alkaliphila]MCK0439424.1 adenylate/guanylate cyclase domain-containing protein [Gordonia alkaliphila]